MLTRRGFLGALAAMPLVSGVRPKPAPVDDVYRRADELRDALAVEPVSVMSSWPTDGLVPTGTVTFNGIWLENMTPTVTDYNGPTTSVSFEMKTNKVWRG